MPALPALTRRERIPELMDDPGLDPAERCRALAGLARINRFSGSVGVLWPPIRELAKQHPGKTLRVLDVATGSGDVPIGLWNKATDARVPLHVDGCDISPTAVAAATQPIVEPDSKSLLCTASPIFQVPMQIASSSR